MKTLIWKLFHKFLTKRGYQADGRKDGKIIYIYKKK